MSESEGRALRAANRGGDHHAFERLTEPYRRELLVHCYRVLGSLEDAEDALQETWLRAWRRLGTFEERAPFRAWLYKIATNSALDARSSRRTRSLPWMARPNADPGAPLSPPVMESIWIGPIPDAMLRDASPSPDALYESRESVSLAFLAVLQMLPPRQRAALVLRDVLGWSVPDVAGMLEMTVAAVNSALQRARATMQTHPAAGPHERRKPDSDDRIASLLSRYVRAWEAADSPALVALLREDAAFAMPPMPQWFRGRADIAAFLSSVLFVGDAPGRFRFLPTRANGSPAFAVYRRDDTGVFSPNALQVLTIVGDEIAAIDSFLSPDPRLLARFGLPPGV